MHAPRPWAIGVAASRALTSCLRNPDLSYGRRVPARSGRRTPDAGDRDNATPAQPLRSGRATPSPAANRANDFADRQRATTPARALCLAPLEPKRRPLWPERLERERDALPARRGLAAGKEHHLTPARATGRPDGRTGCGGSTGSARLRSRPCSAATNRNASHPMAWHSSPRLRARAGSKKLRSIRSRMPPSWQTRPTTGSDVG